MNIWGCPLKITSQNTICFPANYLHVYDIDIFGDYLIRQQFENFLVFYQYCKRELLPNESIVKLRAASTYLPEQWIVDNHLVPGKDSLYLVGIDNGFVVSATAQISL